MAILTQRFLLFAHNEREADGGWRDYAGSFNTLEEAIEHSKMLSFKDKHVVDLNINEIVWKRTQ